MPLMFHEKIRRSPGSRLVIGLGGIDEAMADVSGEVADKRRRLGGGGDISVLFIVLCYIFTKILPPLVTHILTNHILR